MKTIQNYNSITEEIKNKLNLNSVNGMMLTKLDKIKIFPKNNDDRRD